MVEIRIMRVDMVTEVGREVVMNAKIKVFKEKRQRKGMSGGRKNQHEENQDGGIGRHTAPPPTTRPDRKLNGKEVRHQGHKK